MKVSVNWLKDYVNLDGLDIKEFCSAMIMSGSNLDTYETIYEGIKGVVVGKVLSVEKHPDADKLVVCQVNVGKESPIQIVTGAKNVFEGAFVPVAMDGSVLYPKGVENDPLLISTGKLRGVTSEGMMCGATELGFSDKVVPMAVRDGLWILNENYDDKLGMSFDEALGLNDYVVDFEITSNRPDCLSMLGMAREAKATFKREIEYPSLKFETAEESCKELIDAKIEDSLCRRYVARVIKNIKIEQSPWWIQKRLMTAGMRPINNIVDITNFVMLEFGQPMHAFDIRDIEGGVIRVALAEEGEKFTTLDDSERTLDDTMLMIKDANKSVGIAGIMGGLNSEIKEDTNTIVLESANFDKANIRKTSKKLGLRTEASSRFEKGIDPNLCKMAADRFCQLVSELGYGTVLADEVDVYPEEYKPPTITVRVSRINKVIGTELSREDMVEILERLDISVAGEGDEMIVTPPTIRGDLQREVDYVEEIARIYGFNNIPMTFPKEVTPEIKNSSWDLREKARDVLTALGANEIQTFSFINHKILDAMNIDEDSWERSLVELINPMGEDTAAMRSLLSGGMLDVLGRNFSRNVSSMRAFEIGNTFTKNFADERALPDETINLSLGMYGEGEDFFAMKAMIEDFLWSLGFERVIFEKESEYALYHPGRCARVLVDLAGTEPSNRIKMIDDMNAKLEDIDKDLQEGEIAVLRELVETMAMSKDVGQVEIGIMGEIHPDVLEAFGIGTRAYMGEFIFDLISELYNKKTVYTPLPKFPAMSRDIAVLVDEDVAVGQLKKAIEGMKLEIVESVEIFDIYRGEQVEDGKKSVALSIMYKHKDKTLTDEETSLVHNEVLSMLEKEFNAVLRDI